MIDFSTLQGLTIPEGVVTQITDAAGNVLWAVANNVPIVLEVEKITSDTYVSSVSRTGEQFVLLDIYPKTASSTVKVTYGDLTKTLTFSGTNAQQVYFGTFGGTSDSVDTPTSGTLTITGDCIGVGIGSYNSSKSTSVYCSCITGITEWGGITSVVPYMCYECKKLALTELPSGLTDIGGSAFYWCSNIHITNFPHGLTRIGENAFSMPNGDDFSMSRTEIVLPSTITEIGERAFEKGCTSSNTYIRKVTILATIPPTISNNSFGDGGIHDEDGTTYPFNIIVPRGCGEAYKAAEGWSTYANYIVEAE